MINNSLVYYNKNKHKCSKELNDEVVTIYMQKVKGQLHCDFIMFWKKKNVLVIIHCQQSGKQKFD